MRKLPGVSIVIPNYNYARFVGAAIDSGLAQDHPKTEVIVVDDGSTDDSRAVIAGFGNRIRALYQTNQGHVAASNAGWPLARHEIVIFLDADDLLLPDAASTIAAMWRPGVSKLQWTLQVIDDAGHLSGTSYPKYPKGLTPQVVRDHLLRTGAYPCPPTSGNAYTRTVLEALSPIEGHKNMDGILTTAAPLYGDVITINRPLGAYRCHNSNASDQSTIRLARFERYLEREELRLAFLERCCRRLDIALDSTAVKARNVWYQEVQLMAAKLARGSRPLTAGRAIGAILRSGQSPWQRSLRALWIALVTILPLPLARKLIEMRFVPLRRPPVVETIVRAFDGRQPGWQARAPVGVPVGPKAHE
jgi:glycosyltransferase involved in cell wall biosynthesis